MEQRGLTHKSGDPELFNNLLLDVVQAADREDTIDSGLSDELRKIRDFFYFGSAYIYESDPNRQFVLRKHSTTFQHDELSESFDLEEVFTPEQVSFLAENPLHCATRNPDGNEYQHALCEYFNVRSVFQIFITDNVGAVVGMIGMADKREHAPLSNEEYIQAITVLNLIAERSRARIFKRRLEYTSATLENIMDHMGFDIYVNDFYTHEMLYANKSMAAPYGGWENMKGKTCYAALYDGQAEECEYCPKQHLIDNEGNPSKVHVWDYQRPFDGTWFRVICTAFEWTDGRLAQVISSTNINEAKQNELIIQQMAYHDLLTEAPNRRMLEKDLKDLIADPERKAKGFSVLFLDLDNFKYVNDTYGHNGGDALLCHIVDRFMESPLTSGHCYRYGGDEFIFLFEGMSAEEGSQRGQEIIELLETPFNLEGDEFLPTGSIGVAHYPEHGKDYWELLDYADEAMYKVKQQRKSSNPTSV